MIKLLHKKRSSSGVVMIIVVMIIMVLAIISATIISQSMSESKSSRTQANQIVLEELATGVFWAVFNKAAQLEANGVPLVCPSTDTCPVTYQETKNIYGRTYTATAKLCPPSIAYDTITSTCAGSSGPNVWVSVS